MDLKLEKKALKNEIDQLEDANLLYTIKTMLNYAHQAQDIWEDLAFEKELNRRSKDFKSGDSKHYTWDEVKADARKELSSSRGSYTS